MDWNKHFWEVAHEHDSTRWLAGSDPLKVYRMHGLQKRFAQEKLDVVEIGVGFGESPALLNKLGHKVMALDICQNALNRVAEVAETHTIDALPNLKPGQWDVVISHLVFQHCSDDIMSYLIKKLLRILKPGGILSYQVSYLHPGKKLPHVYRERETKQVEYVRPLEQVETMAHRWNVVWENDLHVTDFMGWKVYHLQA